MDDKIIVTHRAALTAKYGAKGLAAIRAAVNALIAADAKRGLKTKLIFLDDAVTMKRLRAKPLTGTSNPRGAKVAIDGIFAALNPDYLMILGAPDVVPHQDLDNPAFAAGDDDRRALGDLPYACDAPYARDAAKFVGPTRVVGRLPDLTGAREPSHLLALLKTVTDWQERPARDFAAYFGLSTSVWRGSTRLSLDNVFGDTSKLLLAPPSGPTYPAGTLGARMHFINCHGAAASPQFYGQKGNNYPVSLTTKATARKIKAGTIAAVECCYGAQLYDSVTLGVDMPICQSYLAQGAYGYLGSTTIAYGPADENGAADLLCQYFLLQVLSGTSIGRATLVARQQFVQHSAQMDAVDLKTLAQFCLLGDPSIHPVDVPHERSVAPGETGESVARYRRGERRAKLKETGNFLMQTKATASKSVKVHKPTAKTRSTLANIAAKAGLSRTQAFATYKVKGAITGPRGPAKLATAPSHYYVTFGKPKERGRKRSPYKVAVLVKAIGGRVVDYRIYHQR